MYLHTDITKEKVTGGITYEERKILLEDDIIKAYIAYVDLENPNISVKVLTASKGSSYLENVKDMAQNNDTTIAINGDFFNMSSSQTNMLGMVYKEGELISTPALDNQASFVMTNSGEVLMEYFSYKMDLISPQGYSTPMYEINKVPVTTGGITMLTPAWADSTWGGANFKELIVQNDIVTEIREPGSEPAPMPKDGYVLVTNPEANAFFEFFAVGDPVKIDLKITPEIEGIKEATGGNTLLVDEGKLAKFTGNVTGFAQRSAVGITEDGKTLILVAVDGRETSCKGLTQYGMAELMISLGAYKAINLDGGGSTSFIKKDTNGNQQTMNSSSWLRSVSTAIGVCSNNLVGTEVKSGELIANKKVLATGDTLTLSASFYDEYGNLIPVPASEIRYHDSLNQDIAEGKYTPFQAGIHTFYATYGDVAAQCDVNVIDDVFAIEIENEDLVLSESASANLTVYGYSETNERFTIPSHLVSWDSSNSKISVENGKVTAKQKAGAVIKATYKGKTDAIIVNKDIYKEKAPLSKTETDSFYGSIKNAKNISVSGIIPKGETLLDEYFARKRLDNLKTCEKAYIFENSYTDFAFDTLTDANKHSVTTSDSTVFITLNSTKGYVPPKEIASIVTQSDKTQNIVVLSKTPIEELTENKEMIKTILSNISESGKNVFVVSSGDKTEVKIENGVRYITAGTSKDYHTTSFSKDADYCTYVIFSISGNNIKYEFVKDKIK